MKTCILFSVPLPDVIKTISPKLFPTDFKTKTFAYIPSDGADIENNAKYSVFWKDLCKTNNATFLDVDNSKVGEAVIAEREKVKSANIIMITGGNTFTLLRNLRRSGLDKVIIDSVNNEDIVISGFSAGAAVLTPQINIVEHKWSYGRDENNAALTDLTGLGILDFEVLPHYTVEDQVGLEEYKKMSPYDVKPISDTDALIFNL